MIPIEKLAYFAGFFDGEGSIGLARKKKPGRIYYALVISVANCDRTVIDEMHAIWGGYQSFEYQGRTSGCWKLKWTTRQAEGLLRDLYPFLRVKKPQADVALMFQGRLGKRGQVRLTNEEEEAREEMHFRIRGLNRRFRVA